MRVARVVLENFRNFPSLDLTFDQGLIVFAGQNGAGKTNFLESLYFGLSLRRFPTSTGLQLFRQGEDFFRMQIETLSPEEKHIEIFCQQQDARLVLNLKIDGQATTRSNFLRQSPVISFLPEDLNLLTHSPAGRRRFLDECLTSASAEYRQALSQYTKALKQRNIALEQKTDIEIWDEPLSQFGSMITGERGKFINFVNGNFTDVIASLSPELKKIELGYMVGGSEDKEEFISRLKESLGRDIERQTTSIGPHRDDFAVLHDNHIVVGFLSRGQMRAITLALKILEQQYLEQTLKFKPLILLDDIFSEFDAMHQQHLLQFLKSFEQVFLTTTHLEEIKLHLPKESQIYLINEGNVQPT